MATFAQLQDRVASYLEKAEADLDTTASQNLIEIAINDVRKRAEMLVDWQHTLVEAELTAVGASGQALSGATLRDAGASISVKKIANVYIKTENGNDLPIQFFPKKDLAFQSIENRLTGEAYTAASERYPGIDPNSSLGPTEQFAYLIGTTLKLEPEPTTNETVYLDAFKWLDDYTADGDTDFFTDHGFSYLMWGAILEVNKKNQKFVDRTEGNVNEIAIKALRDEAFEALKAWNANLIEGGQLNYPR